MKRRDFITLLGCTAAAWPLAARAQRSATPVIGYLTLGAPDRDITAPNFRRGLSEMGYVEGRNVTIEYRWAQNDFSRLPDLAADLVRRRVDVIAALQQAATLAAKAATTTIPIVFNTGADALESGLVAGLNPPGGNLTGINTMTTDLGPKRLALLHELVPKASRFGFLTNPGIPNIETIVSRMQAAAAAINCSIRVVAAGTNREIDTAFETLSNERMDGVVVTPAILFNNRRVQLTTLSVRTAIPTIFADRTFAEAGGLMTYASNAADSLRQFGIYVGRVLNGERPADLPVLQLTKFDLVINLQTARTLRIEVPPTLLAIADEVIE